jgi:hypothetical protein
MQTVWKYPIQAHERQQVEMPEGAEILTVQLQGTSAVVWAAVDTEADVEYVDFYLARTGAPIPKDLTGKLSYINTFQFVNPGTGEVLAFHLFEIEGDDDGEDDEEP